MPTESRHAKERKAGRRGKIRMGKKCSARLKKQSRALFRRRKKSEFMADKGGDNGEEGKEHPIELTGVCSQYYHCRKGGKYRRDPRKGERKIRGNRGRRF